MSVLATTVQMPYRNGEGFIWDAKKGHSSRVGVTRINMSEWSSLSERQIAKLPPVTSQRYYTVLQHLLNHEQALSAGCDYADATFYPHPTDGIYLKVSTRQKPILLRGTDPSTTIFKRYVKETRRAACHLQRVEAAKGNNLQRTIYRQKTDLDRKVDKFAQKSFAEQKKNTKQSGKDFVKTFTAATLDPTRDAISMSRYGLSLHPKCGPKHMAVRGLNTVSAGLNFGVSLLQTSYSIRDYHKAKEMDNDEGILDARNYFIDGSVGLVAGGLFVADTAAVHASLQTVGQILGHIAAPFFLLSSAVTLALAINRLIKASNFVDELDEYYHNTNLSEEERIKSTLLFLKDLVSISPEEKCEIIDKVQKQHPDLTCEEQLKKVNQMMENLIKTKVYFFDKRTNYRAVKEVIRNVHSILQKIENNEKMGLIEGKDLIEVVYSQNRRNRIIYSIKILTTIIGVAAMMASVATGVGSIPFVIGLIAAGIWLCIGIDKLVMICKNRDREGISTSVVVPAQMVHDMHI